MYKPKHFKLYELVDNYSYHNVPHWKLWLAFDDRLLRTIDILRETIGVPITINDWKWGGTREWRGLRTRRSDVYSQFSQHSFGRAADMIFAGVSAAEVRRRIKKMGINVTCEEKIKGVEITWVHVDVRNNEPGYNGFSV